MRYRKTTDRLFACLLALALLGLVGCGLHPISSESRQKVTPGLSPAEVSAHPADHVGQTLLLGGTIVGYASDEDGSTLEILQWQLNPLGEPMMVDDAGHRYLITSKALLDPSAYIPGRLVTLTGTVLGTDTRRVHDNTLSYPLLQLDEIHLWQTPFLYGIRSTQFADTPTYIAPSTPVRQHPYDHTPYAYPYSPYSYRGQALDIPTD